MHREVDGGLLLRAVSGEGLHLDACTETRGDLARGIGGAGIEHDDVVSEADRGQAGLDGVGVIERGYDDGERLTRHRAAPCPAGPRTTRHTRPTAATRPTNPTTPNRRPCACSAERGWRPGQAWRETRDSAQRHRRATRCARQGLTPPARRAAR